MEAVSAFLLVSDIFTLGPKIFRRAHEMRFDILSS